MECNKVDHEYLIGIIPLGIIDPLDELFEQRGTPVEELEEEQFDPKKLGKSFKMGNLLSKPLWTSLIGFIQTHQGDFAWKHHEIPSIDPVIVHKLNEDMNARLVKQKRRSFNPERYAAINIEIEKFVEAKINSGGLLPGLVGQYCFGEETQREVVGVYGFH